MTFTTVSPSLYEIGECAAKLNAIAQKCSREVLAEIESIVPKPMLSNIGLVVIYLVGSLSLDHQSLQSEEEEKLTEHD